MKVAHTMIRVRDLEASVEFYSGFLGLCEVRRSELNDATLVHLADGETNYTVELTYNHDGRDYEPGNQFGHLAFNADDLEAVVEAISHAHASRKRHHTIRRVELTGRAAFAAKAALTPQHAPLFASSHNRENSTV